MIESGIYAHFKGGRYRALYVSTGAEDGVKIVASMPLYGEHAGKSRSFIIKLGTIDSFFEIFQSTMNDFSGMLQE